MNRFGAPRLLTILSSVVAFHFAKGADHAPYDSSEPITEPKVFGLGIISAGDFESHPAFTPDGTGLYFLKDSPGFDFWTICLSEFRDGKWSSPVVAPFSGQYSDADPFITTDGSKFFFISNRPLQPGERAREDTDVWMMSKTNTGWSAPVNLGTPVNSPGNEWYPTVAADGTLYFGSDRPGGQGRTDLYRCRLVNGKYAEPENLGPPVNTEADEYEPFIAPDQSFLIFMAARKDGKGRSDLYLSRQQDEKWTTPVNLGEKINSAGSEYSPKLSPNERYFFWTSTRSTITPAQPNRLSTDQLTELLRSPGNGLGDIYYIDASVLHLH